MRSGRLLVMLLLASGCGRRGGSKDPPPPVAPLAHDAAAMDDDPAVDGPVPDDDAAPVSLDHCTPLPFADSLPIAEASGAVWLPRDGGVIVVVSDSGHDGDYLIIDDDTGEVRAKGKLALGGRGDDLEGLAAVGDRVWALTSSGWMRSWKLQPGGGFAVVDEAYPIDDDGECPIDAVNCGLNYEGLCLGAATGAGPCGGYAVSKAKGTLVCLVADGDRWRADPSRTIAVTHGEALAACDITADGAVWTGENLFGGSAVRRLVAGVVTAETSLGEGFPEAMAIAPDGTIYRFSDMGGAPSLAGKYRCTAAPKDAPGAGAN